jgi:hypothetical protein
LSGWIASIAASKSECKQLRGEATLWSSLESVASLEDDVYDLRGEAVKVI